MMVKRLKFGNSLAIIVLILGVVHVISQPIPNGETPLNQEPNPGSLNQQGDADVHSQPELTGSPSNAGGQSSNSQVDTTNSVTPSQLEHVFRLAETPNVIGLNNYGNTCFLNSTIQVFYHCRLFREGLAKVANDPELLASNPQAMALFDLFKTMDTATSPLGENEINVSALLEPQFNDGRSHRLSDVYYNWQSRNRDMWKPFEFIRHTRKIMYMKSGREDRLENSNRVPVIEARIQHGYPDSKSILAGIFKISDLVLVDVMQMFSNSATIHYTIENAPEAFVISINRMNASGNQKDYTVLPACETLYLDDLMTDYQPTEQQQFQYRLRSFVYNAEMLCFKAFVCDNDNVWYELNKSKVTRKGEFSNIKNDYADRSDLLVYERVH